MKNIIIIIILLFTQRVQSQNIDFCIKNGDIDSNYEEIIFQNYWVFDTIATKKIFGYQYKPWTKGVIYDFYRTNTKMCYSNKQQEIQTSWMTVETEIVLLTFEVQEESTRWLVIYVDDNKIIFQNWIPDSPYPYFDYKPTHNYFVFRKVEDFGCQ